MKLRDKIAAVISASMLAVTAWAIPAYAGGSDDPTPYTVDEDGITLAPGDAFEDNGHVNIEVDVAGELKKLNLHFESMNQAPDSPKSYYIGKSFLPWSAFGLEGDFCVTWVQISLYNEHFGEGSQESMCIGLEGQCPSGYDKPASGWDNTSLSWTADKAYKAVILVGGPPNSNNDDPDGRFKYFYDVEQGETITRVAHAISHLCVIPSTPPDGEEPPGGDDLFICVWNSETETSEKTPVEAIGEDDIEWTEEGCEPDGGVSDNPPNGETPVFICEWDAEQEKSVKVRVDELDEDDIEWTNEGCAPIVETEVLSSGPPIATPTYTG